MDFSNVDESVLENVGSGPVPDGVYRVVANSVEDRLSKDQQSKMFSVEWDIIEGPHSGRKVWQNWVYESKKQLKDPAKMRNIAFARMKKLCLATINRPGYTTTAELTGKPHCIKLKNGKNKQGEVTQNVNDIAGPNGFETKAAPTGQPAPYNTNAPVGQHWG